MSNENQNGTDNAQTAQADDVIGRVTVSAGDVMVERADGSTDSLRAGDPVFQDDIILTGDEATVGIRFADESSFSLGEGGKLQLDEFIYDASAGTGSSLFDVAEGAFAFVSGQIAKTGDDAMSVKTPVATIGVRGTTVAGDVGPEGETEITLLPDNDGTLGEIAVFNDAGLTVMFNAFQRVDVAGADRAPTTPRTIAPDELRQDIADTVRAAGGNPTTSRHSDDGDGGGSDAPTETKPETDGMDQEAAAGDTAQPTAAEADGPIESVEVAGAGDALIVKMADGTDMQIDAAALKNGAIVTAPDGTTIDLAPFMDDVEIAPDRAEILDQPGPHIGETGEFREDVAVLETATMIDGDDIRDWATASAPLPETIDFGAGALQVAGTADSAGVLGGSALSNPGGSLAEQRYDLSDAPLDAATGVGFGDDEKHFDETLFGGQEAGDFGSTEAAQAAADQAEIMVDAAIDGDILSAVDLISPTAAELNILNGGDPSLDGAAIDTATSDIAAASDILISGIELDNLSSDDPSVF